MRLSYDTIRRLVIEPLWERGVITDTASEYGEPGYDFDHDETPIFLIGDWWCRCSYNLHGVDAHHPRVWAQLEAQGVETAFHDEWVVIDDKAYRTTADSYMWQPSIQWNDDICDYMTPDEDFDVWLDWALNDSGRCLMARYRSDLEDAGFAKWEPGDEHDYYSGWHEGMTDDPKVVAAEIRRWSDDREDVVFLLDETSQFYVGFSAWIKPRNEDQ